ncbi:MAG: 2-dehydropantoate 2-reductase [Anaerolineae bacterium]|nr:2-dehydropantoate 2-reductase [Anaerolineae bacterium]
MRIAIFGIGAMGCLFGARLAPHADVTLMGRWPDQLARLRSHPLRVITNQGQEREVVVNVMDYRQAVHELSLSGIDVILILVKSSQTAQAADLAAQVLRPGGLALTLQNGLGNLEIIAEQVGSDRSALGTTTLGAAIDEPGVLREGGLGVTHLATRSTIHMQMQAVAMLFEQGGLHTELVDDVSPLVWGKLAINAAINPLTALLRVSNGALLASSYARGVMGDAAREVAAVAAAKKISLPFLDPAARAEEVARLTAHNRSSMLQDVLRGAPTEIDAICGAIVREGEMAGVSTPINAVLYRLVKALETTTGTTMNTNV